MHTFKELYIGGEWTASSGTGVIEVISPSTEEVIGEVPDGSGRMYVPDLNGPLYLLEDGEPTVYLDVKARFPSFLSWRGLGSGFGFATFHPEFEDNGRFYTVHTEVPTAPGEAPRPILASRGTGASALRRVPSAIRATRHAASCRKAGV